MQPTLITRGLFLHLWTRILLVLPREEATRSVTRQARQLVRITIRPPRKLALPLLQEVVVEEEVTSLLASRRRLAQYEKTSLVDRLIWDGASARVVTSPSLFLQAWETKLLALTSLPKATSAPIRLRTALMASTHVLQTK